MQLSVRLVFFGSGSFAVPTLERLAGHVVLVVTQPARPAGRGMRPHPSPVSLAAAKLGLRIESPERCRAPEFVDSVRSLEPDAHVVASYGQILSQNLLETARRGGINLHGSLLPSYRGAAPIQRAILDQVSVTGVTVMQMDRGMDTGDIIDSVETSVGPEETYGALQERLSILAAEAAQTWLPRIVRGDYIRTPQDGTLASVAPKVEKSEAEIQLAGNGDREYARFRAFTPSPGAFIKSRFGLIKLAKVRSSSAQGLPGVVIAVGPTLVVALGGGALELLELQPEGKKRMTGRDFANGARLKVGDSLF